MKKHNLNIFLIILILLIISCNKINDVKEAFSREPEVSACSEALKTSLAISYSTSLTYAAYKGNVASNVTIVTNTPEFILCIIKVDNNNPLPFSSSNSGTILAAGIMNGDSTAVMSVNFTDIDIREGTFRLSQATMVPVIISADTVMSTFISQDVNFYNDTTTDPVFKKTLTETQKQNALNKFNNKPPTDSSASIDLNQDVWLVQNILTKSPENTEGYSYNILGVGQYARCSPSDLSTIQFVLFRTVVEEVCDLNPVSGYGILREIDISNGTTGNLPKLGTAVLLFNETCDGKVKVPFATGNYIGSSGKRLDLGL